MHVASKRRSFQTTPKQLQGYLTVADPTLGPAFQGSSTPLWPETPDNWKASNVRAGCLFNVILLVWSVLFPYVVLKAVYDGVMRLFKQGDWLERSALTCGDDLLYQ